jgi:membrane protease YdiL (CAAX protease family)
MKPSFQAIYRQYPLQFAALIALLWIMPNILISLATLFLPSESNVQILLHWFVQNSLVVSLCAITLVLGWRFVEPQAGYVQSDITIVIALLIVALPLLFGMRVEHSRWFMITLLTELAVAFTSELAYRGLILRALLVKGQALALIVSSLLFGASQFIHLLYGASFSVTLLLMLGGAMFGFALAAIVLYTGALWPAMFIHALANIAFRCSDITPSQLSIPLSSLIVASMLMVYGIVLLLYKSMPIANLRLPQTS